MRRPTQRELFALRNSLEGLRLDIEALAEKGDSVFLYNVLGTMGVNLSVLHSIHSRLSTENEGDVPRKPREG